MAQPVLVVRTGSPIEPIRSAGGEYDDWFRRRMSNFDIDPVTWDAMHDAAPPAGPWAAVVITGSAASVHDREPWSERCGIWCAQQVLDGVPVFGVCYGHQLLAHALGGRTGVNPGGAEYGVFDVEVLHDDPLFTGLGESFPVYQLHFDAVLEMPEGARSLARSGRTAVQAMAIGPRTRTVQWHPEFDIAYVDFAIRRRAAQLEARESGGAARALETIRAVPVAAQALHNFLEHVARIPRRS